MKKIMIINWIIFITILLYEWYYMILVDGMLKLAIDSEGGINSISANLLGIEYTTRGTTLHFISNRIMLYLITFGLIYNTSILIYYIYKNRKSRVQKNK